MRTVYEAAKAALEALPPQVEGPRWSVLQSKELDEHEQMARLQALVSRSAREAGALEALRAIAWAAVDGLFGPSGTAMVWMMEADTGLRIHDMIAQAQAAAVDRWLELHQGAAALAFLEAMAQAA